MKPALRFANQCIEWVNWAVGWFLAGLLLVMTVLITWQVFARYVMGSPLYFSEEVARFAMVWLTMVGAGYAYRYGSMISVNVVAEFGGRTVARVLNILGVFIVIAFALSLFVAGREIAEMVAGQTSPSIRVSMAWLYSAVPAGAAMILISAVGLLIDEILGERESPEEGE